MKTIAVAGATGTIGCAVVKELIAAGHSVFALVRAGAEVSPELSGATVTTVDMADPIGISRALAQAKPDTIVSCLASRSGSAKDAAAVDFQANLHLLRTAEEAGVDHFVLLSAICVQRPKLAFQHAKIAFERALKASKIDHTIVRPTAFFKSLSGQVDRVLAGKPFLLFSDGNLTRCKPISDRDLARFIAECVVNADRRGATLPIGGPGPAISLKQQGELLFEAAGMEPQFRQVPIGMFDAAIAVLSLGERLSDWMAEKAEYTRIGKYYATESMLLLDPGTSEYSADMTPEFGEDTLLAHYGSLIAERTK